MQYISVDSLNGNEILAVPILSAADVILIHTDTILKDEYIEKLRELNIKYVYVKDEVASEEDLHQQGDVQTSVLKGVYKVDETAHETEVFVKGILEKHIYKHNEDLRKVAEASKNIIDSVISEPEVITNLAEIRNISTDMYTHCINVCTLSTIMALRLKMSPSQVKIVAMGAILHDIGLKYISVPYVNINSFELSEKDELEYKKHTIYGYSSVQEEKWLSDAAKDIILLHHEREDAQGYPFRQIPARVRQEVKLVAVCDDFDSMISGIGSRKMKIYEAIEYIKCCAGIKYDAAVAAKLLETVAVYPVGVKVLTDQGEVGVVVKQNEESPERPIIKMLNYADGSEYQEEVQKDLMKLLTLFIVDTVE